MSWMIRVATASMLAVALATLPLVLDHCAASCEADHETSSTPSCHHAGEMTARIGHVPGLCGHDHNGTVATAASTATTPLRTVTWALAVVTIPIRLAGAPLNHDVLTHAPPGSSSRLDARSLPFRV